MEHTMYKAPRNRGQGYCSNCSHYGHRFANCPWIECRKCKALGHIEVHCPYRHIRARCTCKKRIGMTKVNQTCPIHQKECLCFNRAAEYCGKHNHRIAWDEYGVCEKCIESVQQQKENRLVIRDFIRGCPICIGRGYHEHVYCRVHRRYLGMGEENLKKCYKCQEEFEERSLKIRMRIVGRLINDYAYCQTMERYYQRPLEQMEKRLY